MPAEPGATEGPAQAPKTTTEPFARETGDISSFAKASEHLSSLVDKPITEQRGAFASWRTKAAEGNAPFQRETGKDLSSYSDADVATQEMLAQEAYQNGDLEGFVKHATGITSPSPVFQKLMDEVGAGMQGKTGENPLVYGNWRTKVLQPLRFIAERFKIGESGQPYQRKESDLSSFAEASKKSAEIVNNPELQKAIQELGEVAEKVAVQDAAVDLVEGYVNWAKTTGDARVTKLLSGNIAGIVRRFATNPDRASKTLAELTTEETPALSEEDIKAFRSKLEDAGIVSKEPTPPTTEPPTTTAK